MGFLDSIKNVFSSKEKDDRASLSKRVQVSPQDPQARQKLGVYLLRQGEIVEGLDQLARAAVMYEKDGFAGKAVASLRHMLKHDPGNVEFLRWLIRLLAQEGLMGDALRELENVAGRVQFASDDQKADFFRKIGESLPQSPMPHLYVSDVFRGQRKFFEAVTELEKASFKVQAEGLIPEFSDRLSGLVKAAGDDLEIREACGFLWYRVGKAAEAADLLEDVAQRAKREGWGATGEEMDIVLDAIRGGRNVGNTLSFHDAARNIAESAREQAPPAAESGAAQVGNASGAEGRGYGDEESIVQDALSRLQAKVSEEIGDSDPDARYNLGIAYKEMGLLAEAAGEFSLARRKPELFIGASTLLADTLAAQGDVATAIGVLDEILASGKSNDAERRDVRYHKAILLSNGGKIEDANGILLEIFKEAPGYRDVAARTDHLRR